MTHRPRRDVEPKERCRPGALLAGLAIFAAAVVLLAGDVKTYELRRENRRLAEELARQRDRAARLALESADQADLYARAAEMGMGPPAEAQTVILHLRPETYRTVGTHTLLRGDRPRKERPAHESPSSQAPDARRRQSDRAKTDLGADDPVRGGDVPPPGGEADTASDR